MSKTTKWKPTESVDFYRGKIAEAERFVAQIQNSLQDLPRRVNNKNKDSKHQTTMIVDTRKQVYDAMLNTCEIHITESKKLIQWIETGVQPT